MKFVSGPAVLVLLLVLLCSAAQADLWYPDFDGDGWGAEFGAIESPTQPEGYVALTGDCNDGEESINPSATEWWYDGIDQNCDGWDDYDQDGDGFRHVSAPSGGDDCDDTNFTVHPAAAEVWYDGIDQNCDAMNDFDADRDGYVVEGWDFAAGGSAPFVGDCVDSDPSIHPDALELCGDELDNDCSGLADDGCASGLSEPVLPGRFALHANVPNPFNPLTTIFFDLPQAASASLSVYDVGGRRIRVLLDRETVPKGRTEVVWNGRDDAGDSVPSGIYFYRLVAAGFSGTRTMVLIK